jgi:uncharacterized protein with von Willebrand factor type A (vWA) domain
MTRPILLFFVIVFSIVGCITTAVSPSTTETVENEVTPPIERLKEGFLLVRLRSIEKQMAALRYRRRRTDAYRLRNETKQKRLDQMLDELRRGGVYMKMNHPPSKKP